MSRRRQVVKKELLPDPLFQSKVIAKFINVLMLHGKKSISEQIIYGALELLEQRIKKSRKSSDSEVEGDGEGSGRRGAASPVKYFEEALDNVKPAVEVRSRRVGGATYQVPVEVRTDRSVTLGMRWLIGAARLRGEHGMVARLAGELFDAYEGKGAAVKKREDVHKMAKANQAFAHFRWN
ncbi:MAG: 30S ribosomal protein S7 [Legionellaceae bacterium]|nr:30S ribosomal protein S7 [Legionellaceae bacterium]